MHNDTIWAIVAVARELGQAALFIIQSDPSAAPRLALLACVIPLGGRR